MSVPTANFLGFFKGLILVALTAIDDLDWHRDLTMVLAHAFGEWIACDWPARRYRGEDAQKLSKSKSYFFMRSRTMRFASTLAQKTGIVTLGLERPNKPGVQV
jgi:hypothetical protein